MDRGIYFDAWLPGEHCYHPSKAPRRRGMIEDLQRMRGTTLVWAALGGGAVALPYLEQEAYEQVPARFRQFGFVNDSEFVRLCAEAGIEIFAVVFEAQGWEVAAKLDGGEVAQLNMTEPGVTGHVGLSEFGRGTGPASWQPLRAYFPDGLVNSLGEQVEDILEECTCRDLDGEPLHATWVEVPGSSSFSYYMDRNNPVWREYLKAIVRIQIDAGATGIQLDESETPIGALRYGGCFCKDCVREMREYLQSLPAEALPAALDGVDLSTFDYRAWLLDQGCRARVAPQTLPLYEHYIAAQIRTVNRTFREVARYAREYARSVGRSVRVIGNFFDCIPYYDPMVDEVDLFISEVRLTRYRQPWWYRHAAGFARGRQVIAVENPYGGVIPELNESLKRGGGWDRFRVTIFEASAMGASMALPYGSWLGSEIRDSYWVHPDLVQECGEFLEQIDHLRSLESANETAVLYSVKSAMSATVNWDLFNDGGAFFELADEGPTPAVNYWTAIEGLADRGIPFDVVVAPDADLRPNDLGVDGLRRYATLVVVSAWAIDAEQHDAIVSFLDEGGHVVLVGEYGDLLDETARARVLDHPGTDRVADVADLASHIAPQVVADFGGEVAPHLHDLAERGTALHLVNYGRDESTDRVRARESFQVRLRLPHPVSGVTLHAPGEPDRVLDFVAAGEEIAFTIPLLSTYAVVHLAKASS